jgi:hypothetical protein
MLMSQEDNLNAMFRVAYSLDIKRAPVGIVNAEKVMEPSRDGQSTDSPGFGSRSDRMWKQSQVDERHFAAGSGDHGFFPGAIQSAAGVQAAPFFGLNRIHSIKTTDEHRWTQIRRWE